MFVRFQSSFPDSETGRPLGIFHASNFVRDDPETPAYLVDAINEQLSWFNANLVRPSRFSRSRKVGALEVALCWFRPSANEYIDRASTLAALLSEQTFAMSMITSARPGLILYEDEIQVAAVPFRS